MNDKDIEIRVEKLSAIFVKAIAESITEAGSQKNFSEKTGIHQSRISDYANANYDFRNITVGTLIRLFPELNIIYRTGQESNPSNEIFDIMEKRLLKIFQGLDLNKKVQCFEMMSRTFGEKFVEDAE